MAELYMQALESPVTDETQEREINIKKISSGVEGILLYGGVLDKNSGQIRVLGDVSNKLPEELKLQLEKLGMISLQIIDLVNTDVLDCYYVSGEPSNEVLILRNNILNCMSRYTDEFGKMHIRYINEDGALISHDELVEVLTNMIRSDFQESNLALPETESNIAASIIRSLVPVDEDRIQNEKDRRRSRAGTVPRFRGLSLKGQRDENPFSGKDDREIALLAQSGAREAMGAIYALYYPRIYTYLLNNTLDAALAEDLASDTFMAVYDKMASWSGESFTGWIYRIARNKLIDKRRQTDRRQALSLDTIDTDINDLLIDEGGIDSEHELGVEFSIPVLLKNVEKLRDDYQAVLYMRYVEELPHVEIARRIGKSEGMAKITLHRALIKLREQMIRNGSSKKVIIP